LSNHGERRLEDLFYWWMEMGPFGIGCDQLFVLCLGTLKIVRHQDAGDLSILDDGAAIDDDGIEAQPSAVHHHGLHGIDELTGLESIEIEDGDIGQRSWCQSPKVGTANGVGS